MFFNERIKYINVKLHFIRDITTKESLSLEKIPTEHNPSDIGTNVLSLNKFKSCLKMLNVDIVYVLLVTT